MSAAGGGQAHLSIGEVLAELRDEFPDITISKIRFLESQGLIDPERTPSGYRKFYDQDLARLRWILHQQKEHFLPLKVIKERLDQLGPGDELPVDAPTGTSPSKASDPPAESPAPAPHASGSGPEPATRGAGSRPHGSAVATGAEAGRAAARGRASSFSPNLPLDDGPDEPAADRDEHFSRGELATRAGLDPAHVEQLESFGLLRPAFEIGNEPRYDGDAVEVARAAAGFFARGVEARHLRMYRTFAEREAVLFGQVLLPYLRQRNPDARTRVQEELVELAMLGRRLRSALLRDAVRESLNE
jgi:DNA-binding transcriptional MerR regulator